VTTAFASAAGHAPRPSPLRASGVSLKLRDIATRRHPVRARRGPPSKRHGDAVSLRPTALALSLAQDRLDHSTSSQTSLSSSPPCSERESQLHAPLSAWNGRRRHHARRRPLARRRAHPSTHSRAQHHPQLASLPLTGAPRPARRRRQTPPPELLLRGAAASSRPAPNRAHPWVPLDAVTLFPHFPHAPGEPPRRNPAARPSSVSQTSQGPAVRRRKKSRGLDASFPFPFLLFSKTANFENS